MPAPPDPADLFERVAALVNGDAPLVRRGRFFSGGVAVGIGGTPFHLEFHEGRIAELRRGPVRMRSTLFGVRGDAEAWAKHWRAVPEPHFHDLLAMMKAGRVVLEGNLQPALSNLQYLKDVLAAPRRIAAGMR
jgi:hypothetical protein